KLDTPFSEAELAKLRLVTLMLHKLNREQGRFLADELIRLWFPKIWNARQRLKTRQVEADQYIVEIDRLAVAPRIPKDPGLKKIIGKGQSGETIKKWNEHKKKKKQKNTKKKSLIGP